MTRAASISGLLLAVLVLLEAVPSGSSWWTAGLLLFIAAIGTWRGQTALHAGLCAVGLLVLVRTLPLYFQTLRMWPLLAIILVAAATLGLGVIGFLIDRYRVRPDADPPL